MTKRKLAQKQVGNGYQSPTETDAEGSDNAEGEKVKSEASYDSGINVKNSGTEDGYIAKRIRQMIEI